MDVDKKFCSDFFKSCFEKASNFVIQASKTVCFIFLHLYVVIKIDIIAETIQ